MTRAISAVVFDLDGLLVDSEPVQLRAWELYLARHGQDLSHDLLAQMYGRRLSDAAAAVVASLGLGMSAEQVAAERDELFLAMAAGAIPAMPGALELLRQLSAMDVRLALATSGHRRYVDLALASAGIPSVFDVEVTGELVEHGKPAPDTFLVAADLLGVPAANCLVLEDSPNGVRAARAAGAHVFAVQHLAGKDELIVAGADRVLSSLSELPAALAGQAWFVWASQG